MRPTVSRPLTKRVNWAWAAFWNRPRAAWRPSSRRASSARSHGTCCKPPPSLERAVCSPGCGRCAESGDGGGPGAASTCSPPFAILRNEMKKVALVFALAVIAPSLVLAWLAVRSLRDQEYVVDRQQTLLYQNLAASRASAVAQHLIAAQQMFSYQVENLLKADTPRQAAAKFDAQLRSAWPLAEIGFVVSLDGQVLEPSLFAGSQARKFRLENDRFLCSAETVEVYWNSPKGPINLAKLDQKEAAGQAGAERPAELKPAEAGANVELSTKNPKGGRTVVPTKDAPPDYAASKIAAGETNFREP